MTADNDVELSQCDLVMKGGITSGIVYPGLVKTLSATYRFRQIGGASAGAIAATMAAAAEAGRRRETPATEFRAFDKLGRIPRTLRTDLPKLFQPSPKTAAAFDVLMACIAPGRGVLAKAAVVVGLIVRHGFIWFVLSTVIAMIPALAFDVALLGVPDTRHDWIALIRALVVWLPVAGLVGVLAAAGVMAKSAVAAMNANGFGLCNGLTRRRGARFDPLTVWMEKTLRDLAGLPGDDDAPPVCFRDLWGESAAAAYREVLEPGQGEAANVSSTARRELRADRWTDCVVMTTDLSHRRPYRFPFDIAEFFWCPRCLGEYFPATVIREMAEKTTEVTRDDVDTECPRCRQAQLMNMPLAPDIPLVVAARISLSFPALISAVPLNAVNYGTGEQTSHRMEPVWFSDGGITSNFPMRFFDVAWPQRPTFGINLAPVHPDHPEKMVWRAPPGRSGRLPRHAKIDKLGEFAAAIFDTMQNWSDSTQITMPGFRDRIVEIRQGSGEGGMNLQMSPETIDGLAARGTEAGENILFGEEQTSPGRDRTGPFDFRMHRWMRYRNAMASLDDLLTGMRATWEDQRAFLASLPDDWPTFRPEANDPVATRATMSLADVIDRLGHPAANGKVPRRQPEFRLVPPL